MNNKIKGIIRRYANMKLTIDYTTEPKITFKNGSYIQSIPFDITYRSNGSLFINGELISSNARYAYEQ